MSLGSSSITSWQYFEMNREHTFIDWLHAAGQAALLLQAGEPGMAGLPEYQLKYVPQKTPHLSAQGIAECEIIHIDHYENVVINITKQQFESLGNGRPFHLRFMYMEEISEVTANYADVREGYKQCRFNSNGYMEICVNHGKAASLFGLRLGSKHNNIKIFFE